MNTSQDRSLDPAVIDAAAEFLNHPIERHKKEGNLQSDFEALLRAVGVGTLESHYLTTDGEADIYLPNRRTFIELKAYPLAAEPAKPQYGRSTESPLDQLDRYVSGEINRELQRFSFADDGFERGNWLGIVTDGRNWNVFEYPHKFQSIGKILGQPRHFTNESESLANFLHSLLGERQFGKEWIPSDPGNLFTSLKDELIELYQELPSKAQLTTQTKKDLWLDMMRVSGMIPKDEAGQNRLFVTHSFLIAVVRFVSHSLPISPQTKWHSMLKDGFAAWVLEFERGKKWAKNLYDQVSKYDWLRRDEDVLRSLYQRNVSDVDRKVFGEFYTPDWLAALMVKEVLDDDWMQRAIYSAEVAIREKKSEMIEGIGVLDPTCGSGTFLLHAAHRLLSAKPMQNFIPERRAEIVTRLINGMDIHPVAVEMARVNLERALPARPSMGISAFQIYLGDSLRTDSAGEQTLFGSSSDEMRIISPKGRDLLFPINFVNSDSFADDMRQMVSTAIDNQPLPDYLTMLMTEEDADKLKRCHATLIDVIANEGDSVWTWYAVNIAAPYLLAKRKVDRIVANPPWVKLANIQVPERKAIMESYGRSLGLSVASKQAPHSDIASYFILAARQLYMADPETNPACWLVKKSALSSGQWEPFRKIHSKTMKQSVDLEELQPFGGGDATRSCLLMEHRSMKRFDDSEVFRLKARIKSKRNRPTPAEPLSSAQHKFDFVKVPDPLPIAPSDYWVTGAVNGTGGQIVGQIRQGATLVPHVLIILDEVEGPNHDNLMQVTTRRSKKNPWCKIPPQTGIIPSHWVRPVLTSRQLMAYISSLGTTQAIIPVDLKTSKLHENPAHESSFWRELDEFYERNAGIGKSTPQTLLKQINFRRKLSAQLNMDESLKWIVLYPGSGDIMRGARIHTATGVADSTLFWLPVHSKDESGYLVALLNAACLRRTFYESRESGRHFQLHPWRKIPIPRFDQNNSNHQRLAELCTEVEKIAQEAVKVILETKSNMGQVGVSSAIRNAVYASEAGQEIEAIVTELLPEHATRE